MVCTLHVNEKDMRDIIMFILQICQTDLINGANSSFFSSVIYTCSDMYLGLCQVS